MNRVGVSCGGRKLVALFAPPTREEGEGNRIRGEKVDIILRGGGGRAPEVPAASRSTEENVGGGRVGFDDYGYGVIFNTSGIRLSSWLISFDSNC